MAINISKGVLEVFKLCLSRSLNSFNKQMTANASDKKTAVLGNVLWRARNTGQEKILYHIS